ncbi:MAG: class II aldolase/adducin family protein [Candidatus Aenigmatarchaeota archaeon]|nr:class II aldolase/adducin family protein [Nanoarchaeota archaeon]
MSHLESYTKFTTEMESDEVPQDERIDRLRYWCGQFDEHDLAPNDGQFSYGNMSFRREEGDDSLIITASGTDFGGDLPPERFVGVRTCDNGIVYASGLHKPSSESMLHHALYKFHRETGIPINAIFHGHYDPILERADELGWPVTAQEEEFGTPQLVNSVLAIADQGPFLIMKGHGFISAGESMDQAGELALEKYRMVA